MYLADRELCRLFVLCNHCENYPMNENENCHRTIFKIYVLVVKDALYNFNNNYFKIRDVY